MWFGSRCGCGRRRRAAPARRRPGGLGNAEAHQVAPSSVDWRCERTSRPKAAAMCGDHAGVAVDGDQHFVGHEGADDGARRSVGRPTRRARQRGAGAAPASPVRWPRRLRESSAARSAPRGWIREKVDDQVGQDDDAGRRLRRAGAPPPGAVGAGRLCRLGSRGRPAVRLGSLVCANAARRRRKRRREHCRKSLVRLSRHRSVSFRERQCRRKAGQQ